ASVTSPTGLLPARAEYDPTARAAATPMTARDSSSVRVMRSSSSRLMSHYTTTLGRPLLRPSGPAMRRSHPVCALPGRHIDPYDRRGALPRPPPALACSMTVFL